MLKKLSYNLFLVLMISTFVSCNNAIYPGFYAPGIGPRMIQPIPNNGNENLLPQHSNFVQSYPRYNKGKSHSRFGALVRIIEFEYDITDSVVIIPRITSGFDEGEMTGKFTILLDQYELTYENQNVDVREYVEKVSYETDYPVNSTQQVYNPPSTDVIVSPEGQHATVHRPGTISTIQRNMQPKQSQVVNRSQIYNSSRYIMEFDDIILLLRSKSLSYVIELDNTDITIYPSEEQRRILKKMIQTHLRLQ